MEKLTHQFVEYVFGVAGLSATGGARVSVTLPQYLKQRYSLFEIAIDRRWFMGILLEDNTDFRPATFEKHLRQIMPHASNLEGYCLIAQDLPGYVRQRLVERKIPFVVPGLQMFWPELGLAVQARKARSGYVPVEIVSPATQAVLIFALTGGITELVTPKVLAEKLGYTTMTMSRALDEIEANKMGTVVRKGRERLLYPEMAEVLWKRVLPFIRNPVRETVRIKEDQLDPKLRMAAGETALARQSMLVPPREPIYALGRQAWKEIAANLKIIPVEDEGTCRIQLWRYNPALFSVNGMVDSFSLYLSLGDEGDERIQSALEEMLEKVLWS
jgi:hypothetical protein